ncbi:hypothetical protein [Listeria grayi]|uniref:hypothetical protein n=1 Tax=Listeria grayi TaxID=1641 RepID=UPI00162845C2|nr:hypothetical protein [Listeria grayi]MBC1920699.1 hypothetical protein [Listeria grayi]
MKNKHKIIDVIIGGLLGALNIIFTIYMIKDFTTEILNQEYFAAVNSILSIAILVAIMTISLPVLKLPAKK